MDNRNRRMFEQANQYINTLFSAMPQNNDTIYNQKLKWPTIPGTTPVSQGQGRENSQGNVWRNPPKVRSQNPTQNEPVQNQQNKAMQQKGYQNSATNDATLRVKPQVSNTNGVSISSERLQEAIIWSEILGKPLSKRRKSRFER